MEQSMRPSDIPLEDRERAGLQNVARVIRDNAKPLRGNQAALENLARKAGFDIRQVPVGTAFVDGRGQSQVVTDENSVRIGPDGVLFVGTDPNGKPHDVEDLRHDVGAVLLGGKHPGAGQASSIRFETYAGLVKQYSEGTVDPEALIAKGVAVRDQQGRVMIKDTHLLDALVAGDIQYRDLKYLLPKE